MRFAIIGVGGYIARKHLEAIKSVNGEVVLACDVTDSVGILDQYAPKAKFFTNEIDFEDAIKHAEIEYLVICSSSDCHYVHIKIGARNGLKVICEKPVFIDQDKYKEVLETDVEIYPLLQYRYMPDIEKVKLQAKSLDVRYNVNRGDWYSKSWKADKGRSGGINFNIGAHLFDLATYFLGPYEKIELYSETDCSSMGKVEMRDGNFTWHLSIDNSEIPTRLFKIQDREIILNGEGLHSSAYHFITSGVGVKLQDITNTMDLLFAMKGR